MNYRHAFHAGNFADVLKHVTLVELLHLLTAKAKPLLLLDTHAGAGAYDLTGEEAHRGGEAGAGVLRVLSATAPPPAVARYLAAVRSYDRYCGNRGPTILTYPGSPRLLRAAARPGDRIVLCELQAEQMGRLRRELAGDRQVNLREEDGYTALKASMPPPERRGLVLIDPPYEQADDALRAVRALAQAHRRFATGVYALWYPLKTNDLARRMAADVTALALPRTLRLELQVASGKGERRTGRSAPLIGCGMIVVNPPWHFEAALREAIPWLARTLGTADAARGNVDWLVPERAGAAGADADG